MLSAILSNIDPGILPGNSFGGQGMDGTAETILKRLDDRADILMLFLQRSLGAEMQSHILAARQTLMEIGATIHFSEGIDHLEHDQRERMMRAIKGTLSDIDEMIDEIREISNNRASA